MNGLLYIDKPEGWTSFDVVAKVRGIARKILRSCHEACKSCETPCACTGMQTGGSASNAASRIDDTVKRVTQATDASMRPETISDDSSAVVQNWRCKCKVKVGHTGTLDPAATGLLVICVGKYTKKVPELIKQDKVYEVELTLGKESNTGDKEGEVVESTQGNAKKEPPSDEINDTLRTFVGTIQQTPPAFSAIKVDGKRAYDLARQGKEVKIEPRSVHIHSITNVEYDYPIVTFTAHVGSGTYIRSLAVDIGAALQTGAYMSNLRRTSIADIDISQAVAISDITEDNLAQLLILDDE